MRVLQGHSLEINAEQAVEEAVRGWDDTPEIIFIFSSTKQDPQVIADLLAKKFPDVPMAGCTTSGEHLSGEHYNGALVIAGLCDTGIQWQTALIQGLGDYNDERAEQTANELFDGLGVDSETLEPHNFFCLLFIDGLCMKEEKVTAILADAIEGIALAGGSAGDDLAFKRTEVYYNGGSYNDAATVVMGKKINANVQIVKHQHFVTTPRSLVITKADPETRTVFEMDGYPAIEAYSAALGVPVEELTDELSFLHPVTFSCNDEIYVRSIQKLNEDGSITFYCGIEEGMVLEIAGHKVMKDALVEALEPLGQPDFILGFNCILRALEANEGDTHQQLGKVFNGCTSAMIGFDTYGEQLNGLHINQTLVAVAFQHNA